MSSFGRRLAGILLAGSLALTGLVGCNGAIVPAPTTTQEVLMHYEESDKKDNYHMDLDWQIAVSAMGRRLAIPITGSFDTTEDVAHGIVSMDMTALGNESTDIEMYSEQQGDTAILYASFSTDPNKWVALTLKDDFLLQRLTSEDLLANASFSATDDGYVLSIPASELLEILADVGANSPITGSLSESQLRDAFKDAVMTYTFDKACLLTSIDMSFTYQYGTAAIAEDTTGGAADATDAAQKEQAQSADETEKADGASAADNTSAADSSSTTASSSAADSSSAAAASSATDSSSAAASASSSAAASSPDAGGTTSPSTITMQMTLSLTFDSYGSIGGFGRSVSVPDDVRRSAVDAGAVDGLIAPPAATSATPEAATDTSSSSSTSSARSATDTAEDLNDDDLDGDEGYVEDEEYVDDEEDVDVTEEDVTDSSDEEVAADEEDAA